MSRDDAHSREIDPDSTQADCPRCQAEPGYHADMHVGHVWTNTRCAAYRTRKAEDCTCVEDWRRVEQAGRERGPRDHDNSYRGKVAR